MLPYLAREVDTGEHVLRRQPDSDALGRSGDVMRAQAFKSSLDVLGLHLSRSQVVNALVNNPSTLFADPWLLLRELENKIKNLDPLLEGHSRLEQDGGFDDCFSTEKATEDVIALFLHKARIDAN